MTLHDASMLEHAPLNAVNLIEASAGTGKTYTICTLYLRLLLEHHFEVAQILVVTFTKAATAALRERIRARIASTYRQAKAAVPVNAPLLQRLEHALQSMDEAAIFTIHGFCQRALADRPFTSGQAFELELVGDDEALVSEVIQDYWRGFVASDQCSPELAAYLERIGDSPKGYMDLLKRSISKPMARLQWPADIDDLSYPDENSHQQQFAQAKAIWLSDRQAIADTLDRSLADLNRQTYNPNSLAIATEAWDQYFTASSPTALAFFDEKIALLSRKKLDNRTKKGSQAPKHPFFDCAQALIEQLDIKERALQRSRFRLLRHMLAWSTEALRQGRKQRRQISFDEMLLNLYQALEAQHADDLSASLVTKYPAALIDEFQDTDPLQFKIFSSIYRHSQHPVFFVGDPKQAIYRFRNADLNTYLRARDQATNIYHLVENQRSNKGLIDAVNKIFSANRQSFMLPGLDFHPVTMGSKPRARFLDRDTSQLDCNIWMLPGSRPESDEALVVKACATMQSAKACAAEIARLIRDAQRGLVTIGARPLAPGDIAVLVRTHSQGDRIKKALAALHISSIELAQESVFRSVDASELERILLSIQQPANRSLLWAALATEIIGLDAAAIEHLSQNDSSSISYVERFYMYRDLWQQEGFGLMFRRFLEREDVASRLLVRQDGERRLTNLLHLGELLHEASQVHDTRLALLDWLQKQSSEDRQRDNTQLRLESDRNLVQIMTIHKSKGLEFPVVFCPFLWDASAGMKQGSEEVLAFEEGKNGTVLRFISQHEAGEELDALKKQIAIDTAAETVRLHYVALTRAVYRCYLIAGCYLGSDKRPSPSESTTSMLNWLVAGNGTSPQAWLFDKARQQDPQTLQHITHAWQDLASSAQSCIRISSLPSAETASVFPMDQGFCELAETPDPPKISRSWLMTSFSAMTRQHESRVKDRDETSADLRVLDGAGDCDILRFPRGPQAGICLHQIFEAIAFDKPEAWPGLIQEALNKAHPLELAPQRVWSHRSSFDNDQRASSALDNKLLKQMAASMLHDVLKTDLGHGLVLSRIGARHRINELEFTLPLRNPDLGELHRLLELELEDYGLAGEAGTAALQASELRAYLKGFIDLIIEHQGRYFLIDWKSNHLGDHITDYGPAQLKDAMLEHRYHLQYLIYTLALDRYLRQRLRTYCYEKHFGGVFYLFIRAVRPHWRNPDQSPAGVFFVKPKAQRIAALDALFGKPLQHTFEQTER
ncbi:MAG: exodeoxyribonuclease V subunit beta [Betaproteobacteria bacterium]|nr:exodeoxyribonuclease V subunit beta [Betaproteobacteria bacterium]